MQKFSALEAINNDASLIHLLLDGIIQELLPIDGGHLEIDDEQIDFRPENSQGQQWVGIRLHRHPVAVSFLNKTDHLIAKSLVVIHDNDPFDPLRHSS